MPATFFEATAETREEFLNIIRGAAATFYEVYDGAPSGELEALFVDAVQNNLLLRFDMRAHSEAARARFCRIDDFERKAHGLPSDVVEKPLPYFGSFVPPFGRIDIAWTSDGVRHLIARTRKEVERARQVADFVSRRGTS